MKSNIVSYISLQTLYLAELCIKMVSANEIAVFFKVQYIKKKAGDPVDLMHVDKHQSFSQVDATIFWWTWPGILKVPKITDLQCLSNI